MVRQRELLCWMGTTAAAILCAVSLQGSEPQETGPGAKQVVKFVRFQAGNRAAYGIVETYLLDDRVLGLQKQRTGGGVTGTFFYRGNFAAFTAAGLAIAGVLLTRAFRGRRPLPTAAASVALLPLRLWR